MRLRRSRLRGSATVDYAPDGAVDYVASPLWIMGFALWITRAVLAVDWGEGGDVGAGFAPTPPRQD